MKKENDGLREERDSHLRFKASLSDLLKSILDLKALVAESYLGKQRGD